MKSDFNKNYAGIISHLKKRIKAARFKAAFVANKHLLDLYWDIGTMILQQQKRAGWGAKVIDRLAADLKAEFPDMKGLSGRNIKYMRAFAEAYPDFNTGEKPNPEPQIVDKQARKFVQEQPAQINSSLTPSLVQAALAQLPWYHHITLLDKVKQPEIRNFYIQKAVENGWSRNVMVHQIESELHKRQGKAITNFDNTLLTPESDLARQMFKNPYLFDFLNLGDEARERDLEKALVRHMKKFLPELGRGFAYVGNQFNIEVGRTDFFIDLLFYNTRLHCYVVFELKIGAFKPEFAGKLNFYLNTIDAQIKMAEDKPTIGILLCKTPDATIVEYALRGIDKPMGVADFELKNVLPDFLKTELPTIEELEQELEKEVEEFKENQKSVDEKLNAIKEKLNG